MTTKHLSVFIGLLVTALVTAACNIPADSVSVTGPASLSAAPMLSAPALSAAAGPRVLNTSHGDLPPLPIQLGNSCAPGQRTLRATMVNGHAEFEGYFADAWPWTHGNPIPQFVKFYIERWEYVTLPDGSTDYRPVYFTTVEGEAAFHPENGGAGVFSNDGDGSGTLGWTPPTTNDKWQASAYLDICGVWNRSQPSIFGDNTIDPVPVDEPEPEPCDWHDGDHHDGRGGRGGRGGGRGGGGFGFFNQGPDCAPS